MTLRTRPREWWLLSAFAAFRRQVQKAFRADTPLAERTAWEDLLLGTRRQIEALDARITAAETSINAAVCDLFDLFGDEIALLHDSR